MFDGRVRRLCWLHAIPSSLHRDRQIKVSDDSIDSGWISEEFKEYTMGVKKKGKDK